MQIAETKQSTNTVSQNGTAKRSLFFQPKLTINQPNDIYEQEADAMADKVMRMPDSAVNNNFFFKPAISSIQRKCAHCEEEEKQMQRKESNNEKNITDAPTENYIESLNAQGKSLTKEERNFFEPRFGYEFSNVKTHSGSVAAKSAQSINALAYTTGSNIVFNEGQYNSSTDGKKLMAHELTHVVQQSLNDNNVLQRQEHPGDIPLPTVPHYQLQLPQVGASLATRNRSSTLKNPFQSPFAAQLRSPLLQYVPPIHLTLTPEQIQQILGAGVTNFLQPTTPLPASSNDDGLRLGGDLFRDPLTGSDQVIAVARGLDVGHLRLFNTLTDVLHEPSVTFSAATPGTGVDNSTQLGISILNFHLGSNVEFAPIQAGVDTQGGLAAGAQLEIHTDDPRWSYFINFGYNLKRGDRGNYQFDSTSISFSFYPHFLNP